MRPLVPPPTAETIGHRVTIRYRLDDDATQGATDVVGHVVSVGDRIAIRRRDHSTVSIDAGAIVVWKLVPEPRR